MGTGSVSVAAATAVVGYDLLTSGNGPRFARMAGVDRVITGVGLCGSAAANDAEIEIYVEDVFAGNFYNITTGFPTKDHIIGQQVAVPAGAQIRAKVVDAPGTNPINLVLTWDELPVGSL